MEMIKTSAGKLLAIGYDAKTRTLRVELDGGELLEYGGVGEELWHRFKASGAQWSFYRDNIEEELTPRRVSAKLSGGKNQLEDLFNN
jgi:KTSC domain